MLKQRLTRAPLAAVCGVLALLVVVPAASATDAAVPPEKVDGNPKCADYGLITIAKFDPVMSGTDGPVTLTKHDMYYVKWTSTFGIDRVIVKGGPNANVYTYPADRFGDDWLHAPMNGDKPYGLSHVEFCGDSTPKPGISVDKSGPATVYAGDEATYTFTVRNTGNVQLTDLTVEDDRCAPLTKVPDGDATFDPGDEWTYACTMEITAAMGGEVVNTVEACAKGAGKTVCDTDDHTTKVLDPKIELEKTGAAFAYAGDTVTYAFTATNTGNTTLSGVALTDDRCQDTLVRAAGETDTSFDAGDVWHFTCTAVVPAGVTSVVNTAEVCGTATGDGVEPRDVCDEDDHTFTVPPPSNPPGENPPPSVTPVAVPPSSTPDGGVLPEEIVSGRAQLRGPSGCVRQAFRARVAGRAIRSVTFYVDGRKVKTVGRGKAFTLRVDPKRYGLGRHTIVAVVRFTAASGTKARRLPLTFRRCAQGAVAPRFTG